MTGAGGLTATPAVPVGPPQRVGARGWGSHRTIGSAIRAAADGGVVTIAPGVYPESVALDRDVTIVADTEKGSVELVCPDGPALLVRAGVATVHGLTIRGGQPHMAAVTISGGAVTLHDCDVSGGRLAVAGWAVAELVRCRLHDTDGPAVEASGDSRIHLSGCLIEDIEGTGVALTQSASAELTGDTIRRVTGPGMQLAGDAAAKIVDCELAETGGAGAVIAGSAALVLRASRLRDLPGDGVRAEGSSVRVAGLPATADEADGPDGPDDPRTSGGVDLADCTIVRVGGNGLYTAASAQLVARRCQVRSPAKAGTLSIGDSRMDLLCCEVE
jgi:parallel beta helix pectate lyase-like protein